MPKITTTIRIDPETRDKIKIAAIHQGVSFNTWIMQAIEEKFNGQGIEIGNYLVYRNQEKKSYTIENIETQEAMETKGSGLENCIDDFFLLNL